MNKKLLELLNAINEKKLAIQNLVEAGKLEEAKTEKIKSETMETRAAKPEAIKSEVGTVKLETAAADLEGIRPGAAAGIEGLEPKDVAADSEIVRSKKEAIRTADIQYRRTSRQGSTKDGRRRRP